MLSILVCHSYFLQFDKKQQQRAKPYPPLATLQVAALGSAETLHDNGPIVTSVGTGHGGADESVVEDSTLGVRTYGFGHTSSTNRIAAGRS